MGYYFDEDNKKDEATLKAEQEGMNQPVPADRNKLPEKQVDLSRNPGLAGTTAIQHTVQGYYEVHYDASGYAVKAVRIKDQ